MMRSLANYNFNDGYISSNYCHSCNCPGPLLDDLEGGRFISDGGAPVGSSDFCTSCMNGRQQYERIDTTQILQSTKLEDYTFLSQEIKKL